MAILLGTLDGVWRADDDGCERLGLAGRWVNHLASRGEALLAAISGDGLYELAGGDGRLIWEGDARCCAIGPDGSYYVGSEPAMLHRRERGGDAWTRCDAIDALPTRGEWTFPGEARGREWAISRRYMSLEVVDEAVASLPPATEQEDLLAISA